MDRASWFELRDRLGERVAVATCDDGTRLRATVDACEITLAPVTVGGAEWIEMIGVIAKKARMHPTPVLLKNFELAVGVLGTSTGDLLMRQLLPRHGVELDAIVDALATIAAAMREAQTARS